jgi:hypothetical protein
MRSEEDAMTEPFEYISKTRLEYRNGQRHSAATR